MQATNAKGETIRFSDVKSIVENIEPDSTFPAGFNSWLEKTDRTEGLMVWLDNGDFETAEHAESVAYEWFGVLLDAFYNSQEQL